MNRFTSIAWKTAGLICVMASLLFASPPTLKGWGQAVDPDGDCHFERSEERLTIQVPGTDHNLVADSGDLNAPRVLSPVRGGFIVTVKAPGSVHAGPESSVADGLPYNGTGLLLWVDQHNYLRLERAGLIRDSAYITYANFEHFSGGRRTFSQGAALQDLPTHLR